MPQQFISVRPAQLDVPQIFAVPSNSTAVEEAEVTNDMKTAVRKSLGEFNAQAEKTCRVLTTQLSATIRQVSNEANENLRSVAKEACEGVQKASGVIESFLGQLDIAKVEALNQWRKVAQDSSISTENQKKEVEHAGAVARGSLIYASDEAAAKLTKLKEEVEEASTQAVGNIHSAADEAVSKIFRSAEESLLKLKDDHQVSNSFRSYGLTAVHGGIS